MRKHSAGLVGVIAVMTAHAAYRLLWLPFRLLRGLFRHSAKASAGHGALTGSWQPMRTPVR